MPTEEQIKELAYILWEREGRPQGKDVEHYFAAKQMVEEAVAWERLRAELAKRKAANEPVRTLLRGLASWVDEVGEDYIVMRAERTGRPRKITRGEMKRSSAPSNRIIAALRRLGGYF